MPWTNALQKMFQRNSISVLILLLDLLIIVIVLITRRVLLLLLFIILGLLVEPVGLLNFLDVGLEAGVTHAGSVNLQTPGFSDKFDVWLWERM